MSTTEPVDPTPPPAAPAIDPGRLLRLVRKEVTEVLRDRRTILTLVLMPVLLYPLLAVAFQLFFLSEMVDDIGSLYRVGYPSEEEGNSLAHYLQVGRQALARPDGPEDGGLTEPRLQHAVYEDLEAAVQAGDVDVALRPSRPGPLQVRPRRGLAFDCELLYREDSAYSREAARHVERLIAAANTVFLSLRLREVGVDQRPNAVRLAAVPLRAAETGTTWLAGLVPLILILMTITGAVYPAIDLTAGERERGTLEILIAAPIPRLGLLFAKYVAVWLVAVLTAVVNLGTMSVTLWATGLGSRLFGPGGLSPLVVLEVFGLLLLFAAFFAAVLLILTSFARSFKEAQAALIPLMLVALLPGVVTLLPGLELNGPLALVPLLNITLLSRSLLEGKASLLPALVVVGSTLAYALAALAVASRLFGAEAVLYSESGVRRRWFRRARRVAPRAEE